MDTLSFEQQPEQLSPIVVIATIALIAVFALGFIIQAIGLAL